MKILHTLIGLLAPVAIFAMAVPSAATAQTAPATYAQLDKGIYALVVKITIEPGQVNRFLKVMKTRISDSRKNSKVVDFRILATSNPLVFYGFESFVNKAAFETFAKEPNSVAFLAAMKDIQAKNLEVQFLQPLP